MGEGRQARVEGLGDVVAGGAGGHVGADATARVEVLERALGVGGDGDGSFVNPRRDEYAVAAAGGGRLHFEVAVDVIERPQGGCGPGETGAFERVGEGGGVFLELPPRRA